MRVQADNSNFKAASPISQRFCINPAKPTVTAAGLNSGTPILTSSSASGNQWYNNGNLIENAVSNTFSPTTGGSYTVKVTVDNCASEISNSQILVITGDINSTFTSSEFLAYPNLVKGDLAINLTAFNTSS